MDGSSRGNDGTLGANGTASTDDPIRQTDMPASLRCLDSDADGAPDGLDNCAGLANPSQADADGDGIGDGCDATP